MTYEAKNDKIKLCKFNKKRSDNHPIMRKLALCMMLVLVIVAMLTLVSCGDDTETTVDITTTEPTVDTTTKPTADTTTKPLPPVTTKPVEVRIEPESITVGKIRVQLLSDTLVRLEQAMTGTKFQDKPSFSVINRDDWYKVEYTTETEGDNTLIKTKNYTVVLPSNASNLNKAVVLDAEGNELWHYESKTENQIFLPSPSDELDAWYFTDNPRVIPSEAGYTEDGLDAQKNGWTTDRSGNDCFVFLPGGDYKTFMKDWIELTGRSELITMDMLGYWDSRYYEYTEATALKQINDYIGRGYSIDVLVIDTDWRDASSGIGYEVNERLFPDMARFLERAHEKGVSIVFNDHPEPVSGTNNLLDSKEIEYRTESLTMILSMGLDYWWYDRNWSVALKEVESGLSLYTTGMYAFQWITNEYYESLVKEGAVNEYARRALIMGNVDGIWNGDMTDPTEVAAHRFSIQWTGDITTDATALKKEFYNMIYGGAEMGIPYMSSDIGGHTGGDVSREMYVRWMQYGALSTICRVHCTKPFSRMPWLFGETAEAVTKEYVGMRYRLMPLFYSLSRENYDTGLPIMRRLDINYPQYAESDRNDQYLLGDYILVAPINGRDINEFSPSILSADGNQGLKVEFFKNKSLSGTPAYTGYEVDLFKDWGEGGPSEIGGQSETFSVRYTGQITPDRDFVIGIFADDGVKIWIDNELVIDAWGVYDTYKTSKTLEKGKTYDIKIEYFEDGGKAHYSFGWMASADLDERTVFLPEGTWMDVWTGKEYVGPTTVTCSHKLETSPIFVRQGAIVPLVSQAQNTAKIDWSKITLDIYPSKNYTAEARLYEDDAKTDAYQSGKYRTTEYAMQYEDGALVLKIGKTVGKFPNQPDFTERTYTLRIHERDLLGKVTKVTVDGKEVTVKNIAKSTEASPFAETGAALDAAIAEVTLTAALTAESEVRIYFADAKDEGVNEDYDDSAVDFNVTVNTITKAGMSGLDLTKEGTLDWALFGTEGENSVIRKKNGKGWIGTVESWGGNTRFYDNYQIKWSDGDAIVSGASTNGPVSRRNFEIKLATDGSKLTYTLYIGGYKSVAKITVRDRAGNVETFTFGNLGTNFYRQIVIECEAGEASELDINYSLLSGDNITFSAVTVANK